MQGDRYDSQRAVIGSELQGKLQDMQVLVTGNVMCTLHLCNKYGIRHPLEASNSCHLLYRILRCL